MSDDMPDALNQYYVALEHGDAVAFGCYRDTAKLVRCRVWCGSRACVASLEDGTGWPLLAAPPAAQPTGELAKEIFDSISAEINSRSGIHWDNLTPDVMVGLRQTLIQRISNALDTQTAQPDSAQDFSDLAALEGPLGTAELYLRMIEPDDPDTSLPDGLAAARKRLASHPPQPVTPVAHEIRNNVDGSLDEIVGTGRFSLEQMSGTEWSLTLGPILVSLSSKSKVNGIVVEIDEQVDAKLVTPVEAKSCQE